MPTLKEQISKKKKELKSLEGRLKKQMEEKKKKRIMDTKKKYVKNQKTRSNKVINQNRKFRIDMLKF